MKRKLINNILIRGFWGEINYGRIVTKFVCNWMDSYLVIVHGTHVDVVQVDRENVQL